MKPQAWIAIGVMAAAIAVLVIAFWRDPRRRRGDDREKGEKRRDWKRGIFGE